MRMRKSEMHMRQSDKKMLAFEYEFSFRQASGEECDPKKAKMLAQQKVSNKGDIISLGRGEKNRITRKPRWLPNRK